MVQGWAIVNVVCGAEDGPRVGIVKVVSGAEDGPRVGHGEHGEWCRVWSKGVLLLT